MEGTIYRRSVVNRKDSFTFIPHDNTSQAQANCRICEEVDGKINRLVPRYVNNVKDDKFKVCSFCGEIYPIFDVKLITEYEPKATISDNPFDSGSKALAISKKRDTEKPVKYLRSFDNETEIPDFAGKEDELLKNKLNEGAIIHKISDNEPYE